VLAVVHTIISLQKNDHNTLSYTDSFIYFTLFFYERDRERERERERGGKKRVRGRVRDRERGGRGRDVEREDGREKKRGEMREGKEIVKS